ncbi:hypothetical protein CRG98_000323 [Punica granatum]|uniref:Uncharacterized protein n=1 Tax=Punica granatum TaxID=22663 RepID=A0A2I0LF54_PUNGR|nr:hypothetical protein CRG98_000323 [Punica granatum]
MPVWTQISSRWDPHACALIARLESVHLPGDARRTRVKRSRRYLFTTRRSKTSELPEFRVKDTPGFLRHIVLRNQEFRIRGFCYVQAYPFGRDYAIQTGESLYPISTNPLDPSGLYGSRKSQETSHSTRKWSKKNSCTPTRAALNRA